MWHCMRCEDAYWHLGCAKRQWSGQRLCLVANLLCCSKICAVAANENAERRKAKQVEQGILVPKAMTDRIRQRRRENCSAIPGTIFHPRLRWFFISQNDVLQFVPTRAILIRHYTYQLRLLWLVGLLQESLLYTKWSLALFSRTIANNLPSIKAGNVWRGTAAELDSYLVRSHLLEVHCRCCSRLSKQQCSVKSI